MNSNKHFQKNKAIFLAVFATLLMSVYQILLKIGANNLQFDIIALITNYHLWGGFLLYGIAAIIVITSLKSEQLSIIVPILGFSYFLVSILAYFILHENLTPFKMLGMCVLFAGVVTVGGNKK